MEKDNYRLVKICKCGHKEEFPLTKLEAAFGLFGNKYWKMPCPKCGGTKSDSVSYNTPEIDVELFKIWSENEDYEFSEQDEDLILAKMANLSLLLEALDDEQFPKSKKIVVVNALCTLLFDNLKLSGEKYTEEEKQRMQKNKAIVLPELQKRKEKILEHQSTIWDYIWKKIAPYLS
ncbi:hypothetical protein [Capnocytophaga felis]|uniref:Uncharacterized protein n=1 Tax=Capnocytophaga felis TaxID=2267611 RepID=A0A5M4B8N8_9FLAO|nr:hypothetical protein [Capnocytophaga felis]GET45974.1 hypothetical protein RCZ01_12760 [Capnocytophaga felis]GET49174.1 hypothetical protein RCZ02_20050 [Capnocytophaga felis]